MRIIFADASYWIALMNPRDEWHEIAKLLNYMAEYGEEKRREVVEMAKNLNRNPNVEIVRQTSEQFWAAVNYYSVAFGQGMGRYGLRQFPIDGSERYVGSLMWEALSTDRDFEQAGFTILM